LGIYNEQRRLEVKGYKSYKLATYYDLRTMLDVLRILASRGPLTVTELSHLLNIHKSQASRIVDQLTSRRRGREDLLLFP